MDLQENVPEIGYVHNLNLRVKACWYCVSLKDENGEYISKIERPYNTGDFWCGRHGIWVHQDNTCPLWFLDSQGYTPFTC